MKQDSRAPRAYSLQEITGWITRYRGSGLGLEAFAKQHGLPRNRLHYWVYDRRYSQLGQPSAAPTVFQELRLASSLPLSPWAVEINWPEGPVVRFSAAAPPAWMSAVLGTLRPPC